MATALIIGGTRNLGPDLALALLARGDTVTVLNRGVTRGELPRDVERLRADRSDEAALAAALRGRSFDTVVDTTLYTGADAEAAARILEGRVGRYVVWSTGQVYLVRAGPLPPFRESDYDGPLMAAPPGERAVDHEAWAYGIGKRDAEDALRRALASRAFPFVALRMPMINSARDHYHRLEAYVHRLLDGGPILVPHDQDRLRLRHVFGGDVVAATLRALAAPAGTSVNIAQDETFTLAAMLERIAALLQRDVRLAPVPRATLESLGLLPGCSPWSGRWMSVLDNGESRRILGLRYASVASWLPDLVEAARRGSRDALPGYALRDQERTVAAG